MCLMCIPELNNAYPLLFIGSNITLSPQNHGPICSPSTTLNCCYYNLTFVRVQERADERAMRNTLTTNTINRDSDYDEFESDGLYTLMINHLKGRNCSIYRCEGFDDSNNKVFSDEWKLIIACEFCANLQYL